VFDFLTPVPCAGECESDDDCPEGRFCENGTCRDPFFVTDPLDLDATVTPNPPIPGQPFDVAFSFEVHEGDVGPFLVEVTVPLDKDDAWNGFAATNRWSASSPPGR
jgi:hypothetical protein